MTWTTTPASEIRPGDRVRIKETGVEARALEVGHKMHVQLSDNDFWRVDTLTRKLGLTFEVWREPKPLPTKIRSVVSGGGWIFRRGHDTQFPWNGMDEDGYADDFASEQVLKMAGPDWVELVPKGADS